MNGVSVHLKRGEVIAELPRGFATLLDRRFKDGEEEAVTGVRFVPLVTDE